MAVICLPLTNQAAAFATESKCTAYADCVKRRKMATVPKCQFDLEVAGGIFVNEPCVIGANLVSGRTFHDHGFYVVPGSRCSKKLETPSDLAQRHREHRRAFAILVRL